MTRLPLPWSMMCGPSTMTYAGTGCGGSSSMGVAGRVPNTDSPRHVESATGADAATGGVATGTATGASVGLSAECGVTPARRGAAAFEVGKVG